MALDPAANLDTQSSSSSRLLAEITKSLHEIASLKAQLYAMECENSDLKLRLKEAESNSKERGPTLAQSEAPMPIQSSPQATVPISARSLDHRQKSRKRARSHSSDIVEVSRPSKKGDKEEVNDASNSSVTKPATPKKNLIPYVEISPSKKFLKTSPRTPKKRLKMSPSQSLKIKKTSPSESKIKDILKHRINTDAASQMENHTEVQEPNEIEETSDELVAPNYTPPSILVAQTIDSAAVVESSQGTSLSTQPERQQKSRTKTNAAAPTGTTHLSSIADTYLQSTENLPIAPPPIALEVPRKFLRLIYGGSDQQFFQYVQKQPNLNPSGPEPRRMMFPQLDSNPFMPTRPGEPGLLFSSRYELLEGSSAWTVFCKRNASKAVWLYLGEYECAICAKLTAAQYIAQEDKVKHQWAQRLLKARSHDIYLSMRARIALRRHCILLPATNANDEEKLVRAEVSAIKINKGKPLTEDDIVAAFSKGDEGIDIIHMTCIRYDHIFANDFVAKFPTYPTLAATAQNKNKAAAKAQAGGSNTKSSKKAGNRKSKTQSWNTRELSDTGEEYDDDEGDYEPEPGPGPSTSASRRSARKPTANRRYEDD